MNRFRVFLVLLAFGFVLVLGNTFQADEVGELTYARGFNPQPQLGFVYAQTCNDPTGAPIPCPENEPEEDKPEETSTPCEDQGGDTDGDGTCDDDEGFLPTTGAPCLTLSGFAALKGCPIASEKAGRKLSIVPDGYICISKEIAFGQVKFPDVDFQFQGNIPFPSTGKNSFTLNPSHGKISGYCDWDIPQGTYTFTEIHQPGWNLYTITCDGKDRNGTNFIDDPKYSNINLVSNTLTITLDQNMMGGFINCVFFNVRADAQSGQSNDEDDDGLPDDNDPCPTNADCDGDGIPDFEDKCPVFEGPMDHNGCPPQEENPDTDSPHDPNSLPDDCIDKANTVEKTEYKIGNKVAFNKTCKQVPNGTQCSSQIDKDLDGIFDVVATETCIQTMTGTQCTIVADYYTNGMKVRTDKTKAVCNGNVCTTEIDTGNDGSINKKIVKTCQGNVCVTEFDDDNDGNIDSKDVVVCQGNVCVTEIDVNNDGVVDIKIIETCLGNVCVREFDGNNDGIIDDKTMTTKQHSIYVHPLDSNNDGIVEKNFTCFLYQANTFHECIFYDAKEKKVINYHPCASPKIISMGLPKHPATLLKTDSSQSLNSHLDRIRSQK